MRNIRLVYILGALVVVQASLRAMDGLTQGSKNAIFGFVLICILFRLVSGFRNLFGLIEWGSKRKTRVKLLSVAIFLIAGQALLRSWSGDFSYMLAIATTIEATVFFATCLFLGEWLKNKVVWIFGRISLLWSKWFGLN